MGLRVTGFVSTPDNTRPGRSHELFFVNNRPIKSRLIAHALEDAFRALTPDSRYPLAVIMIDVSPDMVDVNVHPTKTEVKFTRDGEVHHAVSQAVKQALLRYGIVPTATALPLQTFSSETIQDSRAEETIQPALFDPRPAGSAFHSNDAFTLTRAHSETVEGGMEATNFGAATHTIEQMFAPSSMVENLEPIPEEAPLKVPPQPRPFADRLREFTVIGQAQNTYIIALTPDGIAIVDQHVAHERVLYERLTVKRFALGIPVQRLAIPLTVNMSRREAMLLAEHIDSFAESGWEISPFGGESFVVRAIPAVLVNKPYESILKDMIEELVNQSITRKLLVLRDHVTITNACKMAVKAGDPLTIEEMTALLEQLAETENPYLCPHGRPIVVTIGFGDIDKLFKRA